VWRRISEWWIDTQQKRQEAELAMALAVIFAAVATASLRALFATP
jgi:hypothetical protein